ncbi:YdeI/OmpD-associated family protein [Actinoplanes sp. NPDC023801]|uniref:YdeI/OmpD-associated family protein n=1 Tax=Actinoplanes sp. NPDC023801 TaxID=3154595 RepID=UPI00340EDB85
MVAEPSPRTRELVLELPADLVEKLAGAAELSHRTVERLVQDVLTAEVERFDAAFPLPAPPEDLQRALDAEPAAAAFFATVSRTNHHAVILHIEEAKRPATRARRIERTIADLLKGKTPYRD